MRIALSTSTVVNGQGRDGIGVYTAALAGQLPQAGVTVQGFRFGHPPDGSRAFLDEVNLAPYVSYVWRDFVGLPKSVRLDADLIHYTDYRIVPGRVPTCATLHDAVPLKYPEWVSPRLRSLKNLIMKRMVRHADHIFTVSAFAIDEVVEYFGVSRDRIHVIPCGIDQDWLTPNEAATAPIQLPCGQRLVDYFLFVGTFQPRKNLDRVLEAFVSLPVAEQARHPLVIVGRPGWRCSHTVARINQLVAEGLPIHWLQDIGTRDELRRVYTNALGLVFTSLYEGFGIPVLEAFASGVPVITSSTSSLPEVAGEAALIVDPYQVDDIAAAMMRLSRDSDLRLQLIAAGSRRVASCTWTNTAAKMAAVYAKCL